MSLSLAKKLKIIEAVGKGDKSHRDVAKEFSVAKSTVRLLCCKKSTIRKQLSLLSLISYMDYYGTITMCIYTQCNRTSTDFILNLNNKYFKGSKVILTLSRAYSIIERTRCGQAFLDKKIK